MHANVAAAFLIVAAGAYAARPPAAQQDHRYLYIAVPGISIVVFDIDHGHKLVKRIPLRNAAADEESVRGIAASGPRLYVSTTRRLAAIDLVTDKVIWENDYSGHCCDRMAVSPDGRTIYAPAFGSPIWRVIDAATGTALSTIPVLGWPRSTRYSRDGTRAYLTAWESRVLSVADTRSRAIAKEVGPFSAFLCPFTINGKDTLAFANVDGLVGFEVADLQTGLLLDRVTVGAYAPGDIALLECPSHGIAFTPDGRELWVADGVQNQLHVFDAGPFPPMELAGLSACPADAAIEVRQAAHFVSKLDGGHGAVRDFVERVLKAQGRWQQALDAMRNA